jgi:hypothetical protein
LPVKRQRISDIQIDVDNHGAGSNRESRTEVERDRLVEGRLQFHRYTVMDALP